MFSKAPRRVAAHLDVIPLEFAAPPADLDWVRCAHCHEHLDLHQPDSQSPARFLGVCEGCRRWYLVLIGPGHASAMMVVLPESQEFQAAWEAHEGAG